MMMKISLVATKVIPALAAIGLLTACGATETACTSDYDTDTTASTEIQDFGTEEYLITGISSVATDEEKQLKYMLYLQEVLARDIANAYPSVKDADVTLTLDDSDGTITAEDVLQVNILLDLEEELAEDSIAEIAEVTATAVGSKTDIITIADTDGNVLFSKK